LGTIVTVRLWGRFRPRLVPAPQPRLLEPESEADLGSIQAEQALAERFLLRGVHVLVAEDDIYSRRLLGRIFENAGAVVTVACDGGHALQQFRKARSSGHPVQLVIMDLKMPVMDGLQVVAQLRDVDLFDGPVLALTAINNLDVRAECMEAGFDDYLSKPIDRKRLLQLATDYIGKTVSV
jgi:CheY-like chemotaxis protein